MKVHVYEIMRDREGRIIALGNSLEVPVDEAVEGIKLMLYKAAGAPIGVIPEEWTAAVEEAERADG